MKHQLVSLNVVRAIGDHILADGLDGIILCPFAIIWQIMVLSLVPHMAAPGNKAQKCRREDHFRYYK